MTHYDHVYRNCMGPLYYLQIEDVWQDLDRLCRSEGLRDIDETVTYKAFVRHFRQHRIINNYWSDIFRNPNSPLLRMFTLGDTFVKKLTEEQIKYSKIQDQDLAKLGTVDPTNEKSEEVKSRNSSDELDKYSPWEHQFNSEQLSSNINIVYVKILLLLVCRGDVKTKASLLFDLLIRGKDPKDENIKLTWNSKRLKETLRYLTFFTEIMPKLYYLKYLKDDESFKESEEYLKSIDKNQKFLDELNHWHEKSIRYAYEHFDKIYDVFYQDKIIDKIYMGNESVLTRKEFINHLNGLSEFEAFEQEKLEKMGISNIAFIPKGGLTRKMSIVRRNTVTMANHAAIMASLVEKQTAQEDSSDYDSCFSQVSFCPVFTYESSIASNVMNISMDQDLSTWIFNPDEIRKLVQFGKKTVASR